MERKPKQAGNEDILQTLLAFEPQPGQRAASSALQESSDAADSDVEDRTRGGKFEGQIRTEEVSVLVPIFLSRSTSDVLTYRKSLNPCL